jgi:spore coat polysaccharide biosynthesis protein SpsF
LEQAWRDAKLKSEREHVTPYIRNNSDFAGGKLFKAKNFNAVQNFNHIRMTVDEPSDLKTIEKLIARLGADKDWKTYTEYIISNPQEFDNQQIIRNEGYTKSLNEDSHE